MWLFLINPLKLCSYGSWSLQGYVCKPSCCQCHILCLDIEMFKTWSVHFIDWWLCRSHSATQPLCQSGWCSHSATLPEWLEQPLSHSARVAGAATQTLSHSPILAGAATQTLSHSARVAGAATQHSATLPEWLEQPLSHSAILPESLPEWHSATQPATQPLCQSGWSSHSATQPFCHSRCQSGWSSHSATPPEWLEQPLSHSARVAGAATQPLCQSGWSSHSATQPFCHSRCQSGWSSHSATLPQSLEQPLSHSVTQWLSGWCENFRHCAFNLKIDVTLYEAYVICSVCRWLWRASIFRDTVHNDPSQAHTNQCKVKEKPGQNSDRLLSNIVNGSFAHMWMSKPVNPTYNFQKNVSYLQWYLCHSRGSSSV